VSYCLKTIEVSQQYRGQGVGSALLQEIIGFCRDQQVRSLHGEAKGDLPLLRRWYSEQGFTLDAVDNISLQLVEQP
jgi:GNAT superfamily N-acetyltransferase